MPVQPIPDGYHTATPYLLVKGAAAAIDFYCRAFGAEDLGRCPLPDGSLGHAEIRIGNSRFMLSDESPQWGTKGPLTLGGSPVGFYLYVEDCDAAFRKALAAGAKELRPLQDQFYGDRSGTVTDPFGHQWTLATHREDLSLEEVQRRMDEKFGGPQRKG